METSARSLARVVVEQARADGDKDLRIDGDAHLALARESLRELLSDERVPEEVRASLAEDYRQVQGMLDKLEHGHIHIAVFGTGQRRKIRAGQCTAR